jgi:hypothetical protein
VGREGDGARAWAKGAEMRAMEQLIGAARWRMAEKKKGRSAWVRPCGGGRGSRGEGGGATRAMG